jgi:hypothetical protein
MKKRIHLDKPVPEELDELERQLELSLRTVKPDPQFVQRLQIRLSTPATVVFENPSRSGAFLIITLGLFAGALLVWLVQRLR